jgi:DNA repair protein RecN (Recombination protein N)
VLEELRIKGLGVIEDATLPIGPGLTAVTGETGAGKTMVVTGLLLLFGGRADAARVRVGAEQASVDGRLELDSADATAARALERARDAGGDLDDDAGLILRRVVSSAGRSRAHVGGAPVPLAVLGELADDLIAVHGQADQQRLTRPAQQRAALDRFAGVELGDYREAFRQWREIDAVLDERTSRLGELRRETDLLRFGIDEIDAIAPQPGEDAELTSLASRLGHADALVAAARGAHDMLLGNAEAPMADAVDAASLLSSAERHLRQVSGADSVLDELAGRLTDLAVTLSDVGGALGEYAEQLDADPERLAQIESRRALLQLLVRKYASGPEADVNAVLQWHKDATERLAEIDVSDEAIAELVAARDAAARQVAGLAAGLTAARTTAAHRLADAVSEELTGLAMSDARLHVQVSPRSTGSAAAVLVIDDAGTELAAGPDGADEVEFLLQAHPQSPVLPLARSASGGELSRVMLALELCLANLEPVPTMVFDEVDAGIGGRAALEVGRRLARLSRCCQVIVVTHLPQVAAYADRQIVVDRSGTGEDRGVTASDVRVVQGTARTAELARMLAGGDSAAARKHAAELLEQAAAERNAL